MEVRGALRKLRLVDIGFKCLCMSAIGREPRGSQFERLALLESFNLASGTPTEGHRAGLELYGFNQYMSYLWQLYGIPRLLLWSSGLVVLYGLVNKCTILESWFDREVL